MINDNKEDTLVIPEDLVTTSRLSSKIMVLSMNRKVGANALSLSMVQQLEGAISLLQEEDMCVLIIRSTVPGIFCAGADLKERVNMNGNEVLKSITKLRAIVNAIYDFPFPTIAAIDGAAIGGGLELALAADLRVSSSNAKLGLVETKLAIIPGVGGTQRLSRLIPIHLAKELIFTGRLVDGHEANKIGLVNYSVEQNDAGDAAFQRAVILAEEIVKNGPVALKMSKLAINKGTDVYLNSGLCIEALCRELISGTNDTLEGLAAFKEKRPPLYRGE